VCRYNWHSAGSPGWSFPVLKYQYIFQTKYTEAISSNGTRKLLWSEITKMPIAVKKNKSVVSFMVIFGTLSFRIRRGSSVAQRVITYHIVTVICNLTMRLALFVRNLGDGRRASNGYRALKYIRLFCTCSPYC